MGVAPLWATRLHKGRQLSADSAYVAAISLAAVSVLCLIVVGVYGASLGLAADSDSRVIVVAAERILSGEYVPSRSYGFPLYEGLVAAAFAAGLGVFYLNLISLLAALTAVAFAAILARRLGANRIGVSAVVCAVALHPLVLTNSSALMETSLSLAFSLGFCILALNAFRSPRHGRFNGIGAVAAGVALVLIRPDSVILVASVCAALIVIGRRSGDNSQERKGAVLLGAVAGLSALIFYLINGGLSFLSADVLQLEPIARRWLRAGLGIGNALQPVGTFVLVMFGVRLLQKGEATPTGSQLPSFRRAFGLVLAIAVPLYLIRFAALPDELEYILVPLVLVFIWVLSAAESADVVKLVFLASIAQNIMAVSVFERTWPEGLTIRPAVSIAGVWQDFRLRRDLLTINSDDFRRWLAAQAGLDARTVRFQTYGPGFVSDTCELVISNSSLYQIDNPRLAAWPRYQSESYARIVACDASIFPQGGWKVLQPPPINPVRGFYQKGEKLHCETVIIH